MDFDIAALEFAFKRVDMGVKVDPLKLLMNRDQPF